MLTPIIEEEKITQFSMWLLHLHKIVIIAHEAPDGDAIGSSLGLAHFLETFGKRVYVVVPNAFPAFLKWMPGSKDIIIYDRNKAFADKVIGEAQIVCCLDFNGLKRIKDVEVPLSASKAHKMMIDHHPDPEDFCEISMSYPSASSTSELVFRLISQMHQIKRISFEAAQCIYTGMMTDTGGFTYNSNKSELYNIISILLKKGIDKDDIYRKVFNTYSEDRLRLMGYVLQHMKVYKEYHTALITLTKEEQSQFNYKKGDSEGFVNMPLQIKDTFFSCFLREDTERAIIKVSLRSVGTFSCTEVAEQYFNGGGHLNASGGEIIGTMEGAIKRWEEVLEMLKPKLTEHKE